MLMIGSTRELLDLVKKRREIYIYGAGKIAKEIVNILCGYNANCISDIFITNINDSLECINGIKIKAITAGDYDKKRTVLIATGKVYQEEIIMELQSRCFLDIVLISSEFENYLNEEAIIAQSKLMPQKKLKALVVNICDHCNLNCRGCDHFSPIAEKRLLDTNEIVADLKQMKKILDNDIEIISILGGEPLLHPDLETILEQARKIFPHISIWLSTNGLLMHNLRTEFWKCCRENDIVINVTKYPINFDYEKIQKIAENQGVRFQYYHGGMIEKTLGHYPLDIYGEQSAWSSFVHCFHANNECNMLNHGRLYTCTIAPCMPIFNKKFGCHIPLTEEDGIDIYKVPNKETLFEMLSKPMPVCKYCDVNSRTFGHTWGQSDKSIKEWIRG